MRKRVADHDVQRWASRYLKALAAAPLKPHRRTRASEAERADVERANKANRTAADRAAERIGG
jgi:trehalose 6-phosphate synthase